MFASKAHSLGRVKNCILIYGLPSAGTSTVAAYLAERLHVPLMSLRSMSRDHVLLIEERSFVLDDVALASFAKDVEFFKQETNCVLIEVQTEANVRYGRWYSRRGYIEQLTQADFLVKEEGVKLQSQGMPSQEIMPDYTIQNNGSVEELYRQIDDLIGKIDVRKLR